MITEPPVVLGVIVKVRVPDVGVVTPAIVGAAGVVRGVAEVAADASPSPTVLTARIFTLYAVPFARLDITNGEAVLLGDRVTQVEPPLSEYSTFVVGEPPFGPSVKNTESVSSAAVMEEIVGACGTEPVRTDCCVDDAPFPCAFTARRATVYVVPRERPEIVTVEPVTAADDQLDPPSVVTSYPDTALPPFAPAVKSRSMLVSPGVTELIVGASGVPNGVAETADEAVPLPSELTARSRTEYGVPFVRPVIMSGLFVAPGERATHVEPPSVEYS